MTEIKAALIGYGYWGLNIAGDIFENSHFVLSHICDLKEDRLQKAKALCPNSIKFTTVVEEIFKDETVDAVAIAVETSAHYEISKATSLGG